MLWFVLLVCGGRALTIMSSCMFGSESSWLHGMQVFAFSLLLALALVAIADIDRPYQGSVHVADTAFKRAQVSMAEPVNPDQRSGGVGKDRLGTRKVRPC